MEILRQMPCRDAMFLTGLALSAVLHMDPSPDTLRRHLPVASEGVLRRRAELLGAVRTFFQARGFLEVETPLLSAETVIDRYLEPIPTHAPCGPADDAGRWYLQTSPEAAMKRMMAAGMNAIYQVTRSFRQGEQGELHNPEFTIVEWYRSGDRMAEGMALLSALCETVLHTAPAQRISYREAFVKHAGIDPWRAATSELAETARQHAAMPELGDDRDGWLDALLVHRIQPALGIQRPTIVYDFPASQAALACVRPCAYGTVAERFELFAGGIELANGYHELTDADELERRFRRANEQRKRDGRPQLPLARRLLDALRSGIPACTGVALGFDRLVMVALQVAQIRRVMAFPIDRA